MEANRFTMLCVRTFHVARSDRTGVYLVVCRMIFSKGHSISLFWCRTSGFLPHNCNYLELSKLFVFITLAEIALKHHLNTSYH